MALAPSRRGGLWIGTEGRGLGLLDGARYVAFADAGLPNDTIRALHEDAKGDLWIGTYGSGLSRLRDATFSRFGASLGFPDAVVTSFAEAADGTLWIRDGAGRTRLPSRRRLPCSRRPRRGHDPVALPGWRRLWIRHVRRRARPLSRREARQRHDEEGLFNDVVYAIVDDGNGVLWMSCNRGIFHARRPSSSRSPRDARGSRPSRFGTSDGMRSSECNAAARRGASA